MMGYLSFQVINLPYPYETNCGKLQLTYFKGYSKHLCWLEKLTETVITKCGCKDWFMPGKFPLHYLAVFSYIFCA